MRGPAAWRHPTVLSGVLRHGFVGCIRDLVVDGTAMDLTQFASLQDSGECQFTSNSGSP